MRFPTAFNRGASMLAMGIAAGCGRIPHAAVATRPIASTPAPQEAKSEVRTWQPARQCKESMLPALQAGDYAAQPPDVVARDLDGDGRVDVLRRENDTGGSGGRSTYVAVCLSSTGKVLSWDWLQDFYSFIHFIPVPDELTEPGMSAARAAVAAILFGGVSETPDPAMAWLLDSSKLVFHPGRPTLPKTTTIYSTDPSILPALKEGHAVSPPRAVWISGDGGNHLRTGAGDLDVLTTFRRFDVRAKQQLLGTAHGVVLYDAGRDRFAWLYVNVDSGQKLRFSSVRGAKFRGESVVIEIGVDGIGPQQSVRVDLTTGQRTVSPPRER